MPQESSVPDERQGPLHTGIVNELVALTPEWWKAAILNVSVEQRDGFQAMPHEIRSPEGHKEPITPSDELLALTRRLFLLFQEFGRPWEQVTYEVSLTPEGNWKFRCDFTYQ